MFSRVETSMTLDISGKMTACVAFGNAVDNDMMPGEILFEDVECYKMLSRPRVYIDVDAHWDEIGNALKSEVMGYDR